MSRARYAGLDREDNAVRVMAPSYNGAYQYSYRGDEHSVTFLDAISFYNDLRSVRESGLGGVGVSRLGSEDPHIWEVLELREPPGVRASGAGGFIVVWARRRASNKDAPASRPVQRTGVIRSRAILGGLHHHYGRI